MTSNYSVPTAGDVLSGRYRIDSQIGRGGFGVVFKATQLGMERTVALKTLLPSAMVREDRVERFRREAMLARNLNHPNTIRLYDFGQTEGKLLYIAMEFLDGRPLSAVVKEEGPLDPERVQNIASQILKSLAEAHQHGIIHRDLKPGNVMVCEVVGESDFVKVLDFGIAKAFGDKNKEHNKLTKTGVGFGTAYYMAPEQIRGKNICPATDLYALGLLMVELLTGEKVYQAESTMDVAVMQISPDPAPIPLWVLRGPLGSVIQRATQKQIDLRYPSAVEMLRDLQMVRPRASIDVSAHFETVKMDAIVPLAPLTPPAHSLDAVDPPPEKNPRIGMWLGVSVAVLLCLVCGAVFAFWALEQWNQPAPEGVVEVVTPKGKEPKTEKSEATKPPPAPKMVQVNLESEPTGASIYEGDQLVGIAPCTLEYPRSHTPRILIFKLESFEEAPLEVSMMQNGDYVLPLAVTQRPSPKKQTAGKIKKPPRTDKNPPGARKPPTRRPKDTTREKPSKPAPRPIKIDRI